MSIQLLVCDDHEVVRFGLASLLQGTEIEILAEVASGSDAVKNAMDNPRIDLVLLGIRMPDGDGLNALGRIKLERPELPVLMLSTYDNPTYIAQSF